MRIQYIFIFLLFSFAANAQKKLSGRLLIAGSMNPVASANVYLSNTSVGAVSDEKGNFTIRNFPEGRFDLIVSCLGYEIYHLAVRSDQLPEHLEIFLHPAAKELQEVIVESYNKTGWEKWGKLFTEYFIGTAAFAGDCELMNKHVLRFHLSQDGILKVRATQPLIVENKALGYILKYDLEKFEFNSNTNDFLYKGYPFFEEMTTLRKGLAKSWIENRKKAYYGSLMHFMRSVYQDKIKEQKFEVREWVTVTDAEKKRVKTIYPAQSQKKVSGKTGDGRLLNADAIHPDSLAYYQSVMKQLKEDKILVNVLLGKKDIAFPVDSTTVALKFKEHIQVIYTLKRNPVEYEKYIPKTAANMLVSSDLYCVPGKPVLVRSNGSFFDGLDLVTLNYWAWSEKMCNKLPYDYQPAVK
jgi:hypothetical protein